MTMDTTTRGYTSPDGSWHLHRYAVMTYGITGGAAGLHYAACRTDDLATAVGDCAYRREWLPGHSAQSCWIHDAVTGQRVTRGQVRALDIRVAA